MADAKFYLVPDPTGKADYTERAGVKEFLGTDRAGEMISLDDTGLINTSLMPFAQSPDVGVDDDEESARFPVRVDSPTGVVWRWFSLVSILDWVREQIMDMVAPVGTVRLAMGAGAGNRWLFMDGRTLGSDASGAVLSGVDYQRLYYYLWESLSSANIVMTTSTNVPVSKGESAAADWSSNKRIALPDPSSRFLLVSGSGEGLSQRSVGGIGGQEEVTITELQMPGHVHKVDAAQSGTAQRVTFITDVKVGVTIDNSATTTLTGTPSAAISYAKAEDHTHSGSVTINGAGGTHSHVVQVAGADFTHTHTATSEPESTVTIDSASLQFVGGSYTTSLGDTAHSHTGSVSVGGSSSSGNGHTHVLQFSAGYTAATSVTSTPTVTVTPTTATASVYAVSAGSATTSKAGGDVAHDNMPPFFTVAAFIRY